MELAKLYEEIRDDNFIQKINRSLRFLKSNGCSIDRSPEEIKDQIIKYMVPDELEYVKKNIYILTHEIVEIDEILKKYGKLIKPYELARNWTLRKITEFHYKSLKYEFLFAKQNKDLGWIKKRITGVTNVLIKKKFKSLLQELDIDENLL